LKEEMPKIIELARTNLIKADIEVNFSEIASLMIKNIVGSVVITKNNKILGFIDERVILKLVSEGKDPNKERLEPYILEFPTINQDMDILDAWDYIQDKINERWGVVDNDNKIIGIIRKRTINDFRVRILKEELNIED